MFQHHILKLIFTLYLVYATAEGQKTYINDWNKYTLSGKLSSFRTVSLDRDSDKLYLGGVNTMYEFNLQNVSIAPRQLTWEPREKLEATCLNFKTDVHLCQNNIRVFLPINDTHLYACGTMAFLPTCTYVEKESFERMGETESGRWKTPQDPYVSTISVVANQTLFTATRGSAHGNDAIISRALNGVTLRTKAADKYWLHDPVFIGGYHVSNSEALQEKVMLFFREKAEEFLPFQFGMAADPNERNIVSRVATVCVNDHGGSAYVLNRRFATYVKKTLVCNSPVFADDETSFRYTHLESTFQMEDENGRSTIYGIFTMPNDAIAGAAVCAFTMDDIEKALSANQYWSRMASSGVLNTSYGGDLKSAPGRCVPESRTLTQTRLTFSQNHPVKFGYIFPSHNTPFYQEPGTRFSHIVVDTVSSEKSRLKENVTILYMMTASGLLKRVVFPTNSPVRNWTLPDVQLVELQRNESVINMILGEEYLYVVTNLTVVQMPLAVCSIYTSCRECFTTLDPYCIPLENGSCTDATKMRNEDLQQLKTTQVLCPAPPSDVPPEELLIEQLRSNLSSLTDRYNQNEEKLGAVTSERDRFSTESATCNIQVGTMRAENLQLRDQLVVTERTLNGTIASYNSSVATAKTCQRTKNFFMDQALRIAVELRRRPTRKEYIKQMNTLKRSRDGATLALNQCRNEKSKVVRKASTCSRNMKIANDKINTMNVSCNREIVSERQNFNRQLATLRRKLTSLYQSLSRSEAEHNDSLTEADKKLRMCNGQADDLHGYNSLLRKGMKNLTSQNTVLLRDRARLSWALKKYRNDHVCIAGNKWYVAEATNSMFLLMDTKASFTNAEEKCRQHNASLAMFKNNEELGYITNLIRAADPNHYYWIGLVKNTNGDMQWQDGSSFKKFRSRISDQALNARQRSTYCAEVSGSQMWQLAPCYRLRKFICQKDITPTETRERI